MPHPLPADSPLLRALQAACLAAEGADAALFCFYEQLHRRRAALRAALRLDAETLFQGAAAARTLAERGEPHLQWASLALDGATFYPLLMAMAALFATQDNAVLDEAEAIAPDEAMALAQRWYEQGESGLGSTVDALLANALAPTLESAAESLRPLLPLARWSQRYCPICGGWPDFALWGLRAGQRRLLCERCACSWQTDDAGCILCGELDSEARGFYSSADDLYRVEVCDECSGYVKGMVGRIARRLALRPLLQAERILTPGLDLLALQEGYQRPTQLAPRPPRGGRHAH